jgi:hypothetical protein
MINQATDLQDAKDLTRQMLALSGWFSPARGSTRHSVSRHRAPSSQRAGHGAVKHEVVDTELDAAARAGRSVDRGGDVCPLTGPLVTSIT